MVASAPPAPPPRGRIETLTVHGGTPLRGEVPIGGYKHALTVVVAAAVATGRTVTLRNVPATTEVLVLEDILREMGAGSHLADGTWELDTRPLRSGPVPSLPASVVHGSLYLAPALLARFGEVSTVEAGGDQIGPATLGGRRPSAQVVTVMERFGATAHHSGGIRARAGELRGCEIDILEFSTDPETLRGPATSSATKTALLLAACATGETILRHPVDREATRELCDFLCACGVAVTREADAWRVRGGGHDQPVVHDLVSDSTEIVTFAAAAAHVGGRIRLTRITGSRTWWAIGDELRALEAAGLGVVRGDDWVELRPGGRIRPLDLEINCNGFSTDAHPLMTLVLLGADGESRITDHVWTSRLAYLDQLRAMGGDLTVEGGTIRIRPSRLRRPKDALRPADSRAAAVALLAAMGVEGTTRIEDRGHLARSYDGLPGKLRALGGQIDWSGAGSPSGR